LALRVSLSFYFSFTVAGKSALTTIAGASSTEQRF
jgi:hypothetical protein